MLFKFTNSHVFCLCYTYYWKCFRFLVFFKHPSTFVYDFSVIKVAKYLLQDNCYIYKKIESFDAEKLLNMKIS